MKIYGNVICTGEITTKSQITLAPGMQEESICGVYGYGAAGDYAGITVQFRNKMSNTPSSITWSNTYSLNVSSYAPLSMTKNGFYLRLIIGNTGTVRMRTTYTTVGN
jgi:hypothetical protein